MSSILLFMIKFQFSSIKPKFHTHGLLPTLIENFSFVTFVTKNNEIKKTHRHSHSLGLGIIFKPSVFEQFFFKYRWTCRLPKRCLQNLGLGHVRPMRHSCFSYFVLD